MNLRTKGLVFAMEEGEVIVDRPEDTTAAAELEVEQSAGEVAEQAADVEDLTTAIEEAVEDADTLEGVQEIMADSVEQGEGLPEEAAEMAEVAVESICRRLGIRGTVGIPAMESFGSKNTRLASTKIAMESVMDKIKTVWEAIKKAIITLWNKIKDFFFNFFNNVDKIEKLAKELQGKIKALDSAATAGTEPIKSGSLATAIGNGTDANFATAQDMLKMHLMFGNSFKSGVNMFSSVSAAVFSNAKQLTDAKNSAKAVSNIKGEIENFKKAFDVNGLTEAYKGKAAEDVTVSFSSQTKPLVNGDRFIAIVGEKSDKPYVSLSIEKTETKKDSVPVLTTKEMNILLDDVLAVLKPTQEMQKEKANVEKVEKELVASTDAIIKLASTINDNTGENADVKKSIEAVRATVVGINQAASTFTTYLPTANARAAKAVCNYVSKSLNTYKVENKKD